MKISVKVRVTDDEIPMALINAAEDGGAFGVWVNEPWGFDATTVLAFIAAKTEHVVLGTHVVSVFAHSPASLAGKAGAMQIVSKGRFRLGVGTSGPRVAEAWHGIEFRHPIERERDAINIVRMALAGQPVSYRGKSVVLPLSGSSHRPIAFAHLSKPKAVPIYVAAMGPANLRLTGQLADGWLPYFWAPELSSGMERELQSGIVDRNPELAPLQRTVSYGTAFGSNPDSMRAYERDSLAFHLGAMGTPGSNFYFNTLAAHGFLDIATRVQAAWHAGNHDLARREVSNELVDCVSLFGSEDQVHQRLKVLNAAGIDEVIVQLRKPEVSDQVKDLRTLLEISETI